MRRGFAGLHDMVHDVSQDVQDLRLRASAAATPAAPSPRPLAPAAAVIPARPSRSRWRWLAVPVMVLVGWGLASFLMRDEPRQEGVAPAPEVSMPAARIPKATRLPVVEEKPPAGEGQLLTASQLRYCLSEKIRLDGINGIVNRGATLEIERFNARVDDYNGRCGKFKYRREAMDSLRAEVESQRESIAESARVNWRREMRR
jgi:hypothetical protein